MSGHLAQATRNQTTPFSLVTSNYGHLFVDSDAKSPFTISVFGSTAMLTSERSSRPIFYLFEHFEAKESFID